MRIRFWIINLLLLATAIGFGRKLNRDWRVYALQNGPQALVLRPVSRVSFPGGAPRPDYSALPQLNPFHADRNDIVQQVAPPVKPMAPPPLVYGSIIIGDSKFALLATDEGGVPQRIQEGSTLNGYRLAKVLPQSVIFESGGTENEVMFYNALTKLRRQNTRTQASASTSTAPAVRSTAANPVDAGVASPAASTSAGAAAAPKSSGLPPPPPGKKIVETPFGPMYVDDKRPDKDHQ